MTQMNAGYNVGQRFQPAQPATLPPASPAPTEANQGNEGETLRDAEHFHYFTLRSLLSDRRDQLLFSIAPF